VTQLVSGVWTAVEDQVQLPPAAQEVTLRIEGSAPNGVGSFVLTQDQVQITPSFQKAPEQWTAEQAFALTESEALLRFRLLDSRLDEAVRVIRVYVDPVVFEQVLVGGRNADAVQSHWVNAPMNLLVVLNPDTAGAYDLTVGAERWLSGAYVPEADYAAYTTTHAFPAAPGRYRYTVRATDRVTGYQVETAFVAYVHDVTIGDAGTIADTVAGTAVVEDNHDAGGTKDLTLVWGDIDGTLETGYEWRVELAANTAALNALKLFGTGTTGTAEFDDVGPYGLRVGVRASSTDAFTYTPDRATGYVGLNRPPGAPPALVPYTWSAAAGNTATFTVTAADPDGDAVTYTIEKGSLDSLQITYNTTNGRYEWSSAGTGTGYFVKATGAFSWTVPAGTFTGDPDPFTLTFYAADGFGSVSSTTDVSFDLTP
jgi:hypothetical protein